MSIEGEPRISKYDPLGYGFPSMKPWKSNKVVLKLVTGDLLAVNYQDARSFKHAYKDGMNSAAIIANGAIRKMIKSVAKENR